MTRKSKKANGKRDNRTSEQKSNARIATFTRSRIAIGKLRTKQDDVGLTKSETRRLENMQRNLYGE